MTHPKAGLWSQMLNASAMRKGGQSIFGKCLFYESYIQIPVTFKNCPFRGLSQNHSSILGCFLSSTHLNYDLVIMAPKLNQHFHGESSNKMRIFQPWSYQSVITDSPLLGLPDLHVPAAVPECSQTSCGHGHRGLA